MASYRTNLREQVRSDELRRGSGELHRRAELHRLTATPRASERGAKPTRRSQRLLGSPATAVRWTVAHVSAAFAAAR
jgi:hypothetical protein